MDYNERNGSYSDDELLSRFSRPETPRTTVQDDIPDDPRFAETAARAPASAWRAADRCAA